MLTRPSFKKSLIVEQFQGNYLERFGLKLQRQQVGLKNFAIRSKGNP